MKFLKANISEKFEVFFDPPFTNKDYIKELRIILKNQIFKKQHIIVIHREKGSQDKLDDIIETIFVKEYGRSKIIFGKFLT